MDKLYIVSPYDYFVDNLQNVIENRDQCEILIGEPEGEDYWGIIIPCFPGWQDSPMIERAQQAAYKSNKMCIYYCGKEPWEAMDNGEFN